jgi:hypothetical protein
VAASSPAWLTRSLELITVSAPFSVLSRIAFVVLTALVKKSRCAFVNGLWRGPGLAAASRPSSGVRGASGAAPLSESRLEAAEEALLGNGAYRISRVL